MYMKIEKTIPVREAAFVDISTQSAFHNLRNGHLIHRKPKLGANSFMSGKHVGWEAFNAGDLGPTPIAHDRSDVDLRKDSEKNLASVAELYKHVLEEGINT